MLELSALFIVFLGIYLLFIKGIFWKLIVFIFAWAGIYNFCHNHLNNKLSIISILGYNLTWEILIPTVIVMLAMATTKIVIEERI